ncbi:MAG: hypothetical protein EAZ90_24705, partial [Oscillatoriales cyanobacterium]
MFGQGAFFDEPKKDRRDACSTYSNQIGLAQDKNLFVLRDSLLNKDFRISGSPDFMVYNVTNNTFTVMDFYLDYLLDLPGVKI